MGEGQFVDADRMNRLDTTFANRYFDAYRLHMRAERPTRAWSYAFQAADDSEPLVLQHLLLGMNAHISLDLGVASAEIARTHGTHGFRHDFDAINKVLSELVDEIQDELGQTSGVLRRLDTIGGRLDEVLCGFGLAQARRQAWRRSGALGRAPIERHPVMIDRFDRFVERTSRMIHRPLGVDADLLGRLRCSESANVPEMIDRLV
jgi:hypothetical protein